jgi:hypothetical protein
MENTNQKKDDSMKPITFALVGLMIPALASPSFALTRDEAIRGCSVAAGKYVQYAWGNVEGATYRACMAKEGHQE